MKKFLLSIVLLTGFTSFAQIINIPDPAFKNALVNTLCVVDWSDNPIGDADTNDDGEIQLSEAAAVEILNISNQNISSLAGIENFTGLMSLNCSNNQLTALDVGMLPTLVELDCMHNQLTSITANFWESDYDTRLNCSNNLLTDFTIPPGGLYYTVDCSNNPLTNFTILPGESVYSLNLSNTPFTELTVPPQVYNLTLKDCPALTTCDIRANGAYILIEENPQLIHANLASVNGNFDVHNNPVLQSVDLKDGVYGFLTSDEDDPHFDVRNNPALEFVCVDDLGFWYDEGTPFYQSESSHVQKDPGVAVTYYCDLTPVGSFNTLTGSLTYDCGGSASSLGIDDIQLTLDGGSDGSINATGTPDDSGNFQFYVTANGTITPVIENNYFTVSPANYAYSFSGSGETQNVEFCLSPNGSHQDLEVTIIPVIGARPGFDAVYKIRYNNQGTETQSGTLTFTFEDDVTDLVSANPSPTGQSGSLLSWNFSNLAPFETREVDVTLNVNSPVETPAVNIGDILDFNAVIDAGTDETPADNTFPFSQTVVGSFDPNDKIVSTETVEISDLDEYLHYTIRFQNTGTFYAENVVIRDIISDNLDFQTIQIVSASHPWRSLLTPGNNFLPGDKLEIFFEGINLPASADNEPASHGFVTFRIKPQNNLVIGNTIENKAGIYFDYNSAIITNTVLTTVIPQLGVGQFDHFGIKIHPNPTSGVFTISGVEQISVVNIYNQLGQMVKSVQNNQNIDISEMPQGTYFVKVIGAGTSTEKLIKS